MLIFEEVVTVLKKFRYLWITSYMEDPLNALTLISLLNDICSERYIIIRFRMVQKAQHDIVQFQGLQLARVS